MTPPYYSPIPAPGFLLLGEFGGVKGVGKDISEFQGNASEDSKHNKTVGGTRRELIRRVQRVFSLDLHPPLRERTKCRGHSEVFIL